MHFQYLEQDILYSGRELSPHWISEKIGNFGDAIVAFQGACKVESHEMVDIEDRRVQARIEAKRMLHFLAEFFFYDLQYTIALQRLLIASACELLQKEVKGDAAIFRQGNDLFYQPVGGGARKLSVAIATACPVSTLFHFAINIDPSGAPVAAAGLTELGIEPQEFAQKLFSQWQAEITSLHRARSKVLPR